jgi:DtxR family Mn-dependent transcriptional regulator
MNVNELHDRFPAAADYLSQMYLLERDYSRITNLKLSERLGVSKPAVTQSIKRLTKLGLTAQDRYGVINFTDEGRRIAKDVLRRHYLLEHVLVEMLGYPWEKSDREAKKLQVIISGELTEHLYEKLHHPLTCPHGNPFPDSPGERILVESPRLTSCTVGSLVSLLRITEEGEAVEGLLEFCFHHDLKPGTLLMLHSRGIDGLTISKGRTGDPFLLPLLYASHICCQVPEHIDSSLKLS